MLRTAFLFNIIISSSTNTNQFSQHFCHRKHWNKKIEWKHILNIFKQKNVNNLHEFYKMVTQLSSSITNSYCNFMLLLRNRATKTTTQTLMKRMLSDDEFQRIVHHTVEKSEISKKITIIGYWLKHILNGNICVGKYEIKMKNNC